MARNLIIILQQQLKQPKFLVLNETANSDKNMVAKRLTSLDQKKWLTKKNAPKGKLPIPLKITKRRNNHYVYGSLYM